MIVENSIKTHIDYQKQELYETLVICSDYIKRGVLLPYIYHIKNKFCNNAVILHGSVFINKQIDFTINEYSI